MKKMILIAALLSPVCLIAMEVQTIGQFVLRLDMGLEVIQRFENTQDPDARGELGAHANGLITIANQMDTQLSADDIQELKDKWLESLESLKTGFTSFASAQPRKATNLMVNKLNEHLVNASDMSQVELDNSIEVLSVLAQGITEGLAVSPGHDNFINSINELVERIAPEEDN